MPGGVNRSEPSGVDDDNGVDRDAAIEVDHVLIEEAYAAARDGVADAPGLGCAVETIAGVAAAVVDVHRTSTEGIGEPRLLAIAELLKLGLAFDHLGRRR